VRHRRHQFACVFLNFYETLSYGRLPERRPLSAFVMGRHGSSWVVIGAQRSVSFQNVKLSISIALLLTGVRSGPAT
jgi:hypothetical protein